MTSKENPASPTYVYVAGRGHSGTTLLGVLLGNHPAVCSVGELMYMALQCFRDETAQWPGLCGCGERPFDCEFWGPVIADVQRTYGIDLRRAPFSWRISDAGLEGEYGGKSMLQVPVSWGRNKLWRALRKMQYTKSGFASKVASLYQPQKKWVEHRSFLASRIAAASGCRAIVDISKDYLDMRDLYDFAVLPTKVIFITRDCRANVWSQVRLYHERHGEGNASAVQDVIVKSAKDWVRVNRHNMNALRGVPEADRIHVRYEDICRNPKDSMTTLFRFVGLEYGDEVLAFGDKVQHTIAGNHIRFAGETKRIREDLTWKDNLSARDLETVGQICAQLASELGYDLSET